MKAIVVSPIGGRVPAVTAMRGSGVLLTTGRKDLEAEEVAAYLGKLRDLVPDMPRKRKLSKLEVIQRVIRYICELESTLEEDDQQQQQQQQSKLSRHETIEIQNASAMQR